MKSRVTHSLDSDLGAEISEDELFAMSGTNGRIMTTAEITEDETAPQTSFTMTPDEF